MLLTESIDEILTQTDARLADSFFQLLFKKHPELSEFFADTKLERQKRMLTMALQIVAHYYRHPNAAMLEFFKELGASHRERGIYPEDLSKFRDVLLVAIEKFHGSDSPGDLSGEWAGALDSAIELMNAGAVGSRAPD